jgi:hypothetical protein
MLLLSENVSYLFRYCVGTSQDEAIEASFPSDEKTNDEGMVNHPNMLESSHLSHPHSK